MRNDKNVILSHSFKALGTNVSFDLVVDRKLEKKSHNFLRYAETLVRSEEAIFSRFNQESELSHLNNRLGQWTEVSDPMLFLAKKILEYEKGSDGLFDPRIIDIIESLGYKESFEKINRKQKNETSDEESVILSKKEPLEKELLINGNKIMFLKRMDFSGLAKGYLADKVSQLFKDNGFSNFIVDMGGDMYVSGRKNKSENWYIGVENVEEEKILLLLSNQGIATSGINRRNWKLGKNRYHHLINPIQPDKFDFNLVSVSVVQKSVTRADFLAKIIFLMGDSGPKYAEKNKIPAIFVYLNGRYAFSKAMENFLI